MKKNMARTVICIVLTAIMLQLACTPASAYSHPQGLWEHHDRWNAAKDNEDYDTILELAPIIEKLYEGEALNSGNSNMMSIVCMYAARGSHLKGDYASAVSWLKKQIVYENYLIGIGEGRIDNIILAQALISQLDFEVDIYTEASNPADVPYFGAIGEPRVGTLQGTCVARDKEGSGIIVGGESAILVYVSFDPNSEYNMQYWVEYYSETEKAQDALRNGAVIELAWNFPKEGGQLAEINNGSADAYIRESLQYLSTLDSKVLLRVGAEMNVWTTPADPEAFKSAFRKIASYTHQYTNNTAVVFSPNDIPEWGKTYMDFYPGDEYVDWIGVSLYYRGLPSTGNYLTDAFYNLGEFSANPLGTLKPLAETFPNKPIIISECGFAYYSDVTGHQLEDAIEHMRKFYDFLPMLYPQVKAVLYFDTYLDEEAYRYELSGSPALKSAYLDVTNRDVYLTTPSSPAKGYTRLSTVNEKMDVLKLYTSALFPSTDAVSCTYYLNGKEIKTVTQTPFSCEIPVGNLTLGAHTIKAVVTCGSITKTIERGIIVGVGNIIRGTAPASAETGLIASPTTDNTRINGEKVTLIAYKIGGSNYIKLRDLAFVLSGTQKQFDISYDDAIKSIFIASGKPYTAVGGEMTSKGPDDKIPEPITAKLFFDGREISLPAYSIEGNNYFKLRDIGMLMDFSVSWESASSTIVINTAQGYTQ